MDKLLLGPKIINTRNGYVYLLSMLGPRPILIEDGYPIVTGNRVDIVKSVSELP